jgi:hypothetical protein
MPRAGASRGVGLASRFGRALAVLAGGLIGLGGATTAPAQSVAPSQAPAEWVRYAEAATGTISAWLEEDGEAAAGFRNYLHQTRPADDQPTPTLILKVWVDPDGRIDRIEFPPFAHEQANADLRMAVVGRALEAPPPPDMLLPIRLAIQLEAPQPESTSHDPRRVRTYATRTKGPLDP